MSEEAENVVSKIVKQLEKGGQDIDTNGTQVKEVEDKTQTIHVPEVVKKFESEKAPAQPEPPPSPISRTTKLIREYSILGGDDKAKQTVKSKSKNDPKRGKGKYKTGLSKDRKEKEDLNVKISGTSTKDILPESSVQVSEEVDKFERISKEIDRLPEKANRKRQRRKHSIKLVIQKQEENIKPQETQKDLIIENGVNKESATLHEENSTSIEIEEKIVKTDVESSAIPCEQFESITESEEKDVELNCTQIDEKHEPGDESEVSLNATQQPEKSDVPHEEEKTDDFEEIIPDPVFENEEGTYDKVRGFIGQTIHGYLYEQKFALMLYVRGACKLYGINKFKLVTNALKAEPFDDTVFQCCFGSSEEDFVFKTYFVQLKHKNDKDKQYISYEKNCKFFGDKDLKNLSKLIELKKKVGPNNPFIMFRCRPEDCEFVLYTNSGVDESIEGSYCTCPHILSSLHPESNQECKCGKDSVFTKVKEISHGIFTFDVNSTKLKEKIGAKYDSVRESLSVLKVFVNQPSEENLEDVVMKDLANALQKSNKDCKIIYDMLFDEIASWWNETNKSVILTDESNLLNNIVLSHLLVLAKDDITKSNNKFNEFHLKHIEQLINSHQFLVIVTNSNVQLSKLKVLQCLEMYKDKEYFPVTLSQFIKDKDVLLNAWKPVDKILVFEDDSSSEKEKEEFCQVISETIKQKEDKKFIAILHQDDSLIDVIKHKFNCFEYIDTSSYKDLHGDFKRAILDHKVTFQGFIIDIKHLVLGKKLNNEDDYVNLPELGEILEHLISEDVICKVLNNEEIMIGKNLEEVSCISRSLSRHINIKKEIVDLSKHSARYAFSGTTKKQLQCFLNQPEQEVCDSVQSLIENESLHGKCRLFLLSSENSQQEFEELCKLYENDNIHLFEIGEDCFIWKRSYKGIETNKDTNICMKLLHKACSDAFICSEDQVTSSLVPIVAGPGMGKTVMLKHVANLIKGKDPAVLVMYINLSEQARYLVDSENISAVSFCIHSQCGPDHVNMLEKCLMKHIMEETKNAVVLLDGFDEVYSMYKDKVCEIIKSLINLQITQMWIASRQMLQTELEEFLCSLCYVLQPLNKDQQEKLLIMYLNASNSSETDHQTITSNVNQLTKKYLDDHTEFLGNPQHLQMLADILQEEGHVKDVDQITLYRKYIDLKFDKCSEKADLDVNKPATLPYVESYKKNFMEWHEKLALSATLQHKYSEDLNTMFQDVKIAGIVIELKENGRPQFINEKLAVYFAAKWLSDNYSSQKEFLKDKFFDEDFTDMRKIFDLIIAETYECHKCIVVKKQIQKKVLSDSAFKKDRGQRVPLHLAAAYDNADIIEELMTMENKKIKEQLKYEDKILEWTPFDYATKTKSDSAKDRLIKYGAKLTNPENDPEAISRAISENRQSLAGALLMYKELRSYTDGSGNTPLHLAAWHGEHGMVKQILKTLKKEEGSGLLLVKIPPSIMNAFNKDDNTPLHMAAIGNNDCKVLNLLIKEGSDPKVVNGQGNNIIHLAAWHGNSETVNELSEKHKSLVNQQNSHGNTPLCLGVIAEKVETVEVLVQKGADISIKNNEGQNALNLTVNTDAPEVVGILLKSETSRGKIDINNCMANAVLHNNVSVCEELIKNGGNINGQNNDGDTNLHIAAKQGNLEIVKFIVEYGANRRIKNKKGNTPLHEAIELNKTEIVDYLYDENGSEEMFYEAVTDGKIKVVEFLVNKGLDINFSNEKGDTPLHMAVKSNRKSILEYLMNKRANLDAQDFKNNTPLHLAINDGRKDLVELLLKNGANMSKRNSSGNAPIHEAVKQGRSEIVKILLDKGGDKNIQNGSGMTPLHVAVCENNTVEIEFLLTNGADFTILNGDGNTPLHEAMYRYDLKLAEFLIQKGVDVCVKDRDGNTALHALAEIPFDSELAKLCLDKIDDIMSPNIRGNTPLNRAVSRGNKELFKFLVDNGADPSKGFRGFTALHAAVHSGNLEFTKYLIEEYHIDINACEDLKNETPLHIAVKEKQMIIIEYLIEKGARVDMCNLESMTPELLAREKGLEIIENYLREISRKKKSNSS